MREFLGPEAGAFRAAAAGGESSPRSETPPRDIRERISRGSGWFYRAGRTVYTGKTEFQDIEVVETEEFGTALLLDGATQVMEVNEFQYHEPIAHLALLAHPAPRRVLVIGGGDGGVLREVLKHPTVERADLVELDRGVVEFSRTYLSGLNGGAFDDPRLRVVYADGRAFIEGAAATGERWDGIIMDMTDPAGPSLRLYTVEFFKAVKAALRDECACFVMHGESPEARPEAFSRIRRTLSAVFPVVRGAYAYVRMYGTLWSFALCSTGTDPASLDAAEAGRRLAKRGIADLKLVSAESWPALFARYPYVEALLAADGPISTDAAPDFPDSFDPRS